MKLNIPLLKELCEIPGAPGFENLIRQRVCALIDPLVDHYKVDAMGNVIGFKKGQRNPDNKKLMLSAHMDEIGFIVSYIEDNGFLRFQTLGGFDPKTLTAQRVKIHGTKDIIGVMGCKPIHVMTPEEKKQLPKTTDYFVDTGYTKEELEKIVKIGDPITRERQLIEMGHCVNCKSIDNRVSVFILIEALKLLQDCPYDIYPVFSVQEEVGIRGANVASHHINPDFSICIDTTIAYDLPNAQPHEQVTALGKGVAIKILDAMTICDQRMVAFLKQQADKHKLKWQPEILVAGGTDTAGMQRMGKDGSIAGAISIPTRHLHQVIEMAHKEDIEHSILLLQHAIEHIDQHNW